MTTMADPSTQTTLHRNHQRWRPCHGQDNHLVHATTTTMSDPASQPPYIATINDDGHVTANTTTLISRFLFCLFFSCFILLISIATVLCTCNDDGWPIDSTTLHQDHHNHLTQWPSTTTSDPPAPPHDDDGLTHQLNHTTQLLPWPSTTTATSQPTQPLTTTPATGHVTKETRVSHGCKQRPGRQRDSSGKRTQVELTTAAVRPQLPHATINCKSSFFLFCLCFYIDFTYTNSIQINYLTTNWQWQLAAGTATATGCQQQQEQR